MNSGTAIYGTLNNPNFFSQGMALLLVVCLPAFIEQQQPFTWLLLGSGVMVLVLANCSGGLIAFASGTLAVGLVHESDLKSRFFMTAAMTAGVAAALMTARANGVAVSAGDAAVSVVTPFGFLLPTVFRGHFLKWRRSSAVIALVSIALLLTAFILSTLIPDSDGQRLNDIVVTDNLVMLTAPAGRFYLQGDTEGGIAAWDHDGPMGEAVSNGTVASSVLDDTASVYREGQQTLITFSKLGFRLLYTGGTFGVWIPETNLFWFQITLNPVSLSAVKALAQAEALFGPGALICCLMFC